MRWWRVDFAGDEPPEPSRKYHGLSATLAYASWKAMMRRTSDPRDPGYERYAGRGIVVCERWHDFTNFWADMGERTELLTLERIDNDGNYEPSNCKWATRKEQAQNTRTALKEFCAKNHEFTPDNTRRNNRGHRVCRACARAALAAWLRNISPEQAARNRENQRKAKAKYNAKKKAEAVAEQVAAAPAA